MIITGSSVYRYSLELAKPIYIKAVPFSRREGLILRLDGDPAATGIGEIAPLPDFHRDSLEQVISELQNCLSYLNGQELPNSLPSLEGQFEKWLGQMNLSYSSRWGIEMAILNLLAEDRKISVCSMLSGRKNRSIPVNGLITENSGNLRTEIEDIISEGYRTVKVKVGRQSVEQDIGMIKQIRKIMGPELRLRADANRAWSLEQAVWFGQAVRKMNFEYIEEPVRNFDDTAVFYHETGIPVALDESISRFNQQVKQGHSGISALIVKPAVAGGVEKSVQLIRQALSSGIYPVFSSPFESGVGLSFLTHLAAVFAPENTAMGLDTWRWLKENLLVMPFRVRNGVLHAEEISLNPGNIHWERLHRIYP